MRRKIGTLCMILGTALVLAALSLYIWNQREARQAERSVEEVLPQMYQKLEAIQERQEQAQMGPEAETFASVYPDPYDSAMTEVEIDGYSYIGYLSVPALSLELPVMSEWNYRRLRIAPCRYTGSTKTDDLVVMAHNYAKHFGKLSQLAAGDPVLFTDMDDIVSCYEVVEVVTLKPTAVEEMTAGEYDLTLFTCTYGGKSRIAVRCDRVEGEKQSRLINELIPGIVLPEG